MKRFYYCLVVLTMIFSCTNKHESKNQVDIGVPLSLANYRAKHISKVQYDLTFQIPTEQKNPIQSQLVLNFTVNELEAPVYLDFKEETSKIKSVIINGDESPIVHENEHIFLAQNLLTEGSNSVTINFIAGELSLNRNQDYLYTLLVPDRARTLFPCFDQPNIKGIYNLQITAPKAWKVLGGAPELKQKESGDFITHFFAPSDRMSTYLFSFVAGKFESVQDKPAELQMNMLYRESDENKISYSTDSIFRLHQQSLSFLEDYTSYPFPFQKLDFAAIPGFQYGGMEHVGAIQYREDALFLDASATESKKLSRAKLIAHETAHMWFGDLVTMNWFDDVWMKEVFANFMADKIVNPAFLNIDHQLAFMVTHYPNAYSEDRTLGTNPIRQDLENLNNAGSLYGNIIYNKAPIMMRQLELVLGKEAFKNGIQEYIKTYAFENAVWNDLIVILNKKSDIDIEAWSNVWVNSISRPIFNDSITFNENGRISSFKIRQKAEDNSDHTWPQTFDVSFIYADSTKIFTVDMDEKYFELKEAIGLPKPNHIVYNSNGLGYGVFPIEEEELLMLPNLKNNVTRGYSYINAYENMLTGSIDQISVLQLFKKALTTETNELLVSLISRYTNDIFWKYLSEEHRILYQKDMSEVLWSQLNKPLQANIKKTLFSSYKTLSYTGQSRENLYRIWIKELQIPNLNLNPDDYTELAMDLALYDHSNREAILNTAKETITNPDKLERFIFLQPSLSKNVQDKTDFFESLKLEKNRAKESWVANAMNNINHPLYQKESITYLRSSLDLLDEIQKTGDIFFPKRWLNSTIGNYNSAKAYQILQDFLSDNPDLKPSLKNKLLQASDDLRRIQLLHKKVDKSSN